MRGDGVIEETRRGKQQAFVSVFFFASPPDASEDQTQNG